MIDERLSPVFIVISIFIDFDILPLTFVTKFADSGFNQSYVTIIIIFTK